MSRTWKDDISVAIEHIGPEFAEELLARNHKDQRGVRPYRVVQMASDMRRGAWGLSPDSIAISKSGQLLNGQHRLAAVVKSQKSQWFIVSKGWPEKSILVMDDITKRTDADAFRMLRGMPNATVVAALVKLVLAWKQMPDGAQTFRWRATRIAGLSRSDLLDEINRDPTIAESAAFARRHMWPCIAVTHCAFLHHLFSQVSTPELAAEFLAKMISGESLAKRSPLMALRNYYINSKSRKKDIDVDDVTAVAVKAWNAWRSGAELVSVRWSMTEPMPHPNP